MAGYPNQAPKDGRQRQKRLRSSLWPVCCLDECLQRPCTSSSEIFVEAKPVHDQDSPAGSSPQ